MAETNNDARVKNSSSLEWASQTNTFLQTLSAFFVGMWGKQQINQPEVGKYDWFKYLVWLIIGLAFVFVLYKIFTKNKKNK